MYSYLAAVLSFVYFGRW